STQCDLELHALSPSPHPLVAASQLERGAVAAREARREAHRDIGRIEQQVGHGFLERGGHDQREQCIGSFGHGLDSSGDDCIARRTPKRRNRPGNRSRVSSVELIRPPMTTIASGRWISDPGPVANSSGTRPNAAIVAVIMTGRSRRSDPSMTTSSMGMRRSTRWLKWLTMTTPLSTAMPSSAMKPTEAGTDRYSPESNRAKTPPISAKGTLATTSTDWRTEPRSEERRVGKAGG